MFVVFFFSNPLYPELQPSPRSLLNNCPSVSVKRSVQPLAAYGRTLCLQCLLVSPFLAAMVCSGGTVGVRREPALSSAGQPFFPLGQAPSMDKGQRLSVQA